MKKWLCGTLLPFLKKETVLTAAWILALISAFAVPPNRAYVTYIDWRVLGILLSLMTVMAGFQKNGFFDFIGTMLLARTKDLRQLLLALVFLCFFTSMLITNDVALITFVPFAILTLKKSRQENKIIPVLVLQTIAANLGSMLTPIGNPQNLYLYNLAEMEMGEFVTVMLPYTLVSGFLLLLCTLFVGKEKPEEKKNGEKWEAGCEENGSSLQGRVGKEFRQKNLVYGVLFLLSILVVLRLVPYYLVLAAVLIVTFFMDKEVLKKVDYGLLFTFMGFFIFTGNIGNIAAVREFLQQMVAGREILTGILASQVISNVPAALLLSGFTENYQRLLLGVNLGGLGTLIASMASLISYKIYGAEPGSEKGKYLLWFTGANIIFLAVLAGTACLL